MIFFPKNAKSKITDGLDNTEYRCHCVNPACHCTMIDKELVEAYHKFRFLIGKPLIINSGFRCSLHNFMIGGRTMSRHLSGEAIDISNKNLPDPLETTKIARQAGFKYIKFYVEKDFWHFDTGER